MKLWMSSEQMSECDENIEIQREIEIKINELIKDCKLGDYKEWTVITIILNEKGPNYNEIIRRSIKEKFLEFRLKINYYDYINADTKLRKKYVVEVLLRSLDLMEKWKDIKQEERTTIKTIIQEEYKEFLYPTNTNL